MAHYSIKSASFLHTSYFCTFEKTSSMTAEESLKLFEIVNRHFKNEEDARAFVSEIDKLVTERSKEEARYSATKEDLSAAKIDLIKW